MDSLKQALNMTISGRNVVYSFSSMMITHLSISCCSLITTVSVCPSATRRFAKLSTSLNCSALATALSLKSSNFPWIVCFKKWIQFKEKNLSVLANQPRVQQQKAMIFYHCIVDERFSNDCTSTKEITPGPITTGANSTINQSEFLETAYLTCANQGYKVWLVLV